MVVSKDSFGKEVSNDDGSGDIVELRVKEVEVASVRVVSVVGGVGLMVKRDTESQRER